MDRESDGEDGEGEGAVGISENEGDIVRDGNCDDEEMTCTTDVVVGVISVPERIKDCCIALLTIVQQLTNTHSN